MTGNNYFEWLTQSIFEFLLLVGFLCWSEIAALKARNEEISKAHSEEVISLQKQMVPLTMVDDRNFLEACLEISEG